MRTTQRRLQTWGAGTCALAILAMAAASAMAAAPATTAYHFSSHPMISGTVVTVNDREMAVDTDQGERVILAMDSHTMAPRDLAPGMVMRAEFLALEDCRFYAERIMPIRSGMSTDRLQAYANTHDGHETVAGNGSAFSGYPPGHGTRTSSSVGEHSSQTTMNATPSTADYLDSTRPMISGRVVSVNDHRMVVASDQGQQVNMVMDSRTMVPGTVEPGDIMRADFTRMKDGRYYARRIRRVASGVADREQAYAGTHDSDIANASTTDDCGGASTPASNTTSSALERRGTVVVRPDAVAAARAPEPVAQRPETLPQTASNQPLLALLAFLALGAAGALSLGRRRHAV